MTFQQGGHKIMACLSGKGHGKKLTKGSRHLGRSSQRKKINKNAKFYPIVFTSYLELKLYLILTLKWALYDINIFFLSLKEIQQSGGASRWRVCYQWGFPRLVVFVFANFFVLFFLYQSPIFACGTLITTEAA